MRYMMLRNAKVSDVNEMFRMGWKLFSITCVPIANGNYDMHHHFVTE